MIETILLCRIDRQFINCDTTPSNIGLFMFLSVQNIFKEPDSYYYYYYYYCFKFILYYYLLGGDLQVSSDLNNKSKRFTPALYEWCLQCSLVWSTVALWPMGDLGATEGSYPIPSYLFLTFQSKWHNFCSHFPIMMTSISRSFNWLSFSVSFVLLSESSSMAISISR